MSDCQNMKKILGKIAVHMRMRKYNEYNKITHTRTTKMKPINIELGSLYIAVENSDTDEVKKL